MAKFTVKLANIRKKSQNFEKHFEIRERCRFFGVHGVVFQCFFHFGFHNGAKECIV